MHPSHLSLTKNSYLQHSISTSKIPLGSGTNMLRMIELSHQPVIKVIPSDKRSRILSVSLMLRMSR